MKNCTHKGIEFLGMGNRAWGRSYQCPMPEAAGLLSLSTHEGMEFLAAFNKSLLQHDCFDVLLFSQRI
jgi:hypothetical protein